MNRPDQNHPSRGQCVHTSIACVFVCLAGLTPLVVQPDHDRFATVDLQPATSDVGAAGGAADSTDEYTVLSEIRIQADGPDGVDTYEIFRRQLGETCIEAPDVFPNNHQEGKHIVENTGGPHGAYFTFIIHRDYDEDKNDDGSKGRQRNEIRGDDNSPDIVKARQGDRIRYHWYFRIDPAYRGDENHTIFFQLHNVDVGPIAKIQSFHSDLAFRYDADNRNRNEIVLDSHPIEPLLGQWLEAEVVVLYHDYGYLRMTIRDESGAVVMHTERQYIDMWTSNFTRPKWGIYRALDRSITNSEDTVDFADITIQEIATATPVEKSPSEHTGANLEAYPNPFGDHATVAVTLERAAPVQVEVLDTLGRRVATLVDGMLPIGRSELRLEGAGLAAGVYTLSMRAEGRLVSRMILYHPR